MENDGELIIRAEGAEWRFAPGTLVRIGRDPSSDVMLANANVSRNHAVVEFEGEGWMLRDAGSAQGTFAAGRRSDAVPIRGAVTVRLGQEGSGVDVALEAGGETVGARPGQPIAVPADATVGPTPGPSRPGGVISDGAVAGETVVTSHAINVECAGRSYSFMPSQEATLGRDPSCDVVSSNPTVSRRHASLRHDGSSWILTDLGSGGGTFVDGKRITSTPVQGTMAIHLGEEESGERVVLATSGQRAKGRTEGISRRLRQGKAPVAVAAVAIVAAVVAMLAIVLVMTRNESVPDNDELARASVRLETDTSLASGTVVDAEKGLILTNAHVAEPQADGQAIQYPDELDPPDNPRTITVWVASGVGEAAEPTFFAEVVAVDGYLDLAVVQITETTGGDLIEEGDPQLAELTELDLLDDESEIGDKIRVFGFPAATDDNASTFSDGAISSERSDRRLETDQAWLNITAPIGKGSSGGLAADDQGRIVGVPTQQTAIGGEEVNSIRPIRFAEELIEAAREGKDYVSPHTTPLPDDADFSVLELAEARQDGFETDCQAGDTTSVDDALAVSFSYSGFEAGEHQDFLVEVYLQNPDGSLEELLGRVESTSQWPLELEEEGCVTATVPIDAIPAGTLVVFLNAGPNYEPVSDPFLVDIS